MTRRARTLASGAAALALLAPGLARAEEPSVRIGLAAEAAAGLLDEDVFATVSLKARFTFALPGLGCDDPPCAAPLSIALEGPLRFRLADRSPADSSVIREEDWDQPEDLARILRAVAYGHPDSPVFVRLGEIGPSSLGQGFIVDRTFNTLTPDLPRRGVYVRVARPVFSVDALVDDVLAPNVVSASADIAPVALFAPGGAAQTLRLGSTFAADLVAPTVLVIGPDGAITSTPTRVPEIAEARRTVWYAAHAEFLAIDLKSFAFGAVLGASGQDDVGSAGHVALTGRVGEGEGTWRVDPRVEGFVLSGGYIPRSVGPLYPIERVQFVGWGVELPAPKRRVVASIEHDGALGVYADVGVSVDAWNARAVLAYQAVVGVPDAQSITALAAVTLTDGVDARVFFAKNALASPREVFSREGGLLVSALRLRLGRAFYGVARYNRSWRLDDRGVFTPITIWDVGVGAALGFAAE